MNKKSNNRRAFLKQGALLGGGILLMRPNPQPAMAEEKPKDPAHLKGRLDGPGVVHYE